MSARLSELEDKMHNAVRKAYRKVALQLHPDKLGRARTSQDERDFQLLQVAKDNLQGQEQRKFYLLAPTHAMFEEVRRKNTKMGKKGRGKTGPASYEGGGDGDSGNSDSDGEREAARSQKRVQELKQKRRQQQGGNFAHQSNTQKMQGMTADQRRVMQNVLTTEQEQDQERGRVLKLTNGQPNRCSLPRVVDQTQRSSRIICRLQWRCKYSIHSGQSESFELQVARNGYDKRPSRPSSRDDSRPSLASSLPLECCMLLTQSPLWVEEDGGWVRLYKGSDDSTETVPLPGGDYLFRVSGKVTRGCANGGGCEYGGGCAGGWVAWCLWVYVFLHTYILHVYIYCILS